MRDLTAQQCSYKADVQPHNLAISLERDALAQEGIRTLAKYVCDTSPSQSQAVPPNVC